MDNNKEKGTLSKPMTGSTEECYKSNIECLKATTPLKESTNAKSNDIIVIGSSLSRGLNEINTSKNAVYNNDGGITCTGSILKRVRRYNGKENDPKQVIPYNYLGSRLSLSTPNQKRVRFFTPNSDQQIGYRSHSNSFMPKKLDDDDDFQTPMLVKSVTNNNQRNRQDGAVTSAINVTKTEIKQNDKFGSTDNPLIKEDEHRSFPINPNVKVLRNRRRNKKDFEHWLLVRYQPRVLTDAIRSLSINQRQWVKRTGFRSLLSFRMNEYPQALSYYIAQTFQADSSSFCLGSTIIPITDEDVNEVLGLPRGKEKLLIIRNNLREERWRNQFVSGDRAGWKVTANMVADAIKRSNEADQNFKLNFLVLMSNILIEGPKNPYVRQTILGFTGDFDHCNQYNWCEFLLSHLRVGSIAWNENPTTKHYTGSIPLLVYFYMDRVVSGKRQVRRKKPTFIGWSDALILNRQISDISSKIVFHGKIALPLRCKDSDDESSYEDNTWNNMDAEVSDSDEVQFKNGSNIGMSNIVFGEVCKKNYGCPDGTSVLDVNQIGDTIVRNHRHLRNVPDTHSANSHKSDAEVTQSVFDNLKDSLDAYENYQGKCIMYLSEVKELFTNNGLVNSLESKFLELISLANDFVNNGLQKQSFREKCTSSPQIIAKNHVLSDKAQSVTSEKSIVKSTYHDNDVNVSPLDDELCLSTQDCLLIDSLSVPKGDHHITSPRLFENMKSQSNKSPASGSISIGFKTPADGSVFKVQLDATIPSFDLGIDGFENMDANLQSQTSIESHQMNNLPVNERPIREKKIGDTQKSPYIQRFTNIHAKYIKKEESDLWDWLHSNTRHPNRILFKWQNIMCYKLDFQSMRDGELVMTSTIDVWCCFLNSQEFLRSPTTPRRLYCYIETTFGTLNAFNENTIEKKYNIFEENMEHLLHTSGAAISDFDLIFFPIHHVNHYYVICYNLKNPSVDILDNRKSERPLRELYGHQPSVLHTHFTKFLEKKKSGKLMEISQMNPRRLVMMWQTKNNRVDCGVFAMRHMETYFGGGARTWDSKLAVESYTQKRQISTLRLLFTFRMLSSNINSFYGVILDEINDPTLLPEEAGIDD